MGQYVGLDVSLEVTTVHVLDEQGKRVWRGTCVTHPTAIEATIRKHAPEVVRIGLETGPLTTWLQGNRVKKSCGNKACQEIVVPGGDFAPKA
jgi:hypothetical protein